MRGGGYGIIGDIIVGLIGGFLFGPLVEGDTGFWGSMVVATSHVSLMRNTEAARCRVQLTRKCGLCYP
jgi:hypothetical protein